MKEFTIQTILTLLNLKGIGPAYIGKHEAKILEFVKSKKTITEILQGLNNDKYSVSDIEVAADKAIEITDLSKDCGIQIVNLFDEEYPSKLKEGGVKWPLLYCLGNVQFQSNTIGIIGSRNSTPIGEKIAERLGSYFVENNCTIVNGIAKGIDAAGMNGVGLKQNSLGVTPGGLAFNHTKTLSKDYHEEANAILEAGGGLISSFAPAIKQDQYKVIEYCKLQAALSDALILVQSIKDGGSRFTLGAFSRLNRTLGIIDASKYDKGNAINYSTNDLILKEGKKGLSEMCDVKEEKIKCSILSILEKEDYVKVLEGLNSGGKNTLF